MKSRYVLLLAFLLFKIQYIVAQHTFTEIGVGIGNVVGNRNARGKGEIYFNIIKPYKFGQLGIDFSTGGNFFPGTTPIIDQNMEIVFSNDFKFSAITILYRLPVKTYGFVEPRLGYSSLYTFVHTDDKTKISQSNVTIGIGIGVQLNNFTLSLRYQHLGVTPNYIGTRHTTIVKSNPEPLDLLLFRVSYRINLKKLF